MPLGLITEIDQMQGVMFSLSRKHNAKVFAVLVWAVAAPANEKG
jgi:hypothetical protein